MIDEPLACTGYSIVIDVFPIFVIAGEEFFHQSSRLAIVDIIEEESNYLEN